MIIIRRVNNNTAIIIGNPIDKKYLVAGEVHQYVYDGTYWVYVGTIADNVLIYVDEARETLFITTSLSSGDGVRY